MSPGFCFNFFFVLFSFEQVSNCKFCIYIQLVNSNLTNDTRTACCCFYFVVGFLFCFWFLGGFFCCCWSDELHLFSCCTCRFKNNPDYLIELRVTLEFRSNYELKRAFTFYKMHTVSIHTITVHIITTYIYSWYKSRDDCSDYTPHKF